MTNRENPIHRIKVTSDPNQNDMDPKHGFLYCIVNVYTVFVYLRSTYEEI